MRVNFKLRYLVGVIAVSFGLSLPLTARSSVHLAAKTPVTSTVTIKVIGARNAKGKLGAALFQDAKGFPEDTSKALRQQEADINPQTLSAQIVFRDLPQRRGLRQRELIQTIERKGLIMISEAVVALPFSQPHPRQQLAEAERAAPLPQFDCFIGVSAHLPELKEFISVQAAALQPVLLIGERGLRQEQIARALTKSFCRIGSAMRHCAQSRQAALI